MADAKISALPVATAMANADLYCIVQGGVTKQITGGAAKIVLGGTADPNGSVSGTEGQIYVQVSGGVATFWTNVGGGTVWV